MNASPEGGRSVWVNTSVAGGASQRNADENDGAGGKNGATHPFASSGCELKRNGARLSSQLETEIFASPSSKFVLAWPACSGTPAQPAKELDDGSVLEL